jgi:TonB-dependent SusC/RagA subfamily outer membrane receptor
MSSSQSRISLARVVAILACTSAFAALGGCVHRSPAAYEQSLRSFPGVQISRTPTGGFTVRIISGLVGSAQPLYIIDDAPMPVDPDRGIDWFKPEDIVRIRALKDPAETSVYGPRGVNGVILITTKDGLRMRTRAMPRM